LIDVYHVVVVAVAVAVATAVVAVAVDAAVAVDQFILVCDTLCQVIRF
jgi:hypothetical protein